MQKFVINMVTKHYSTLEVEADNIEEARDIVEDGELDRNGTHLCKMYMKKRIMGAMKVTSTRMIRTYGLMMSHIFKIL